MSGSCRNTSSKLDSGDEPEFTFHGITSSRNSKCSYLERNYKLNPRMGFSNEESFSGGRVSNKDDIVSKDHTVSDARNTDESNKMELSPVNEDLENKSIQSPKTGCSRSVRSRSRSSSPRRSFRRDSRTNDRYGMRTECRYFSDGQCRKGSECPFLHLDNKKFDDSRVSSRRQDESLLYSRPRRRFKGACVNYENGRCRMGESCKYMHDENTSKFNKDSTEESTGEMEIDRRCTGSSFEQGDRHGRNQRRYIPCKFYAFGRCRYGENCKFSHDTQACKDFKDDLLKSRGGDQASDSPKSSDEISLHEWLIDDSVADVENKKEIMVDPEPGFNNERGHSLDKNTVHGESTFSSDVKEAKNDSSNVLEHEQSKQQVAPEQAIHENVNVSHSSSSVAVEQSEVAASIVPPSVRTIEGVQNQEEFGEKKQTAEENVMDANLSEVGSSNAPIGNMITQLSSIPPASLLYILGAIQLFPQLSAPSVSITPTKPGPSVGFPKLRDPRLHLRDSNTVDEKEMVPTISPTQNIPKDAAEIPSLLSDSGQHFDASKKSGFSEEQLVKIEHSTGLQKGENVEDDNEKNKVVDEGKPSSSCENKTAEHDGRLENLDQKSGPEEANTVKDVKGVRAFKFALVEFVKELLKPSWHCGKIKKEDYKAIVKKVADKVIGTVQPPHIPQTKEQIDRYLSLSKPRIDKLVQAYVEKFQKA